jgi:hypothetical protein
MYFTVLDRNFKVLYCTLMYFMVISKYFIVISKYLDVLDVTSTYFELLPHTSNYFCTLMYFCTSSLLFPPCKQHKKQAAENRAYLLEIIRTIVFLGKQGVACKLFKYYLFCLYYLYIIRVFDHVFCVYFS